MKVGRIGQLWRYPVKSMAGERLTRAALTVRGIPGDRGWALFDESRGGVTNAKRLAPLRQCRVRYTSEPVPGDASPPVEITLPDGTRVASGTTEAADRLGVLLGRAVSLRGLGPAGSEAAPRLTSDGDGPDIFRELMGVLPDEPLPDLSELSGEKLQDMRQGNFFDAMPIHLITRTTLDTLARIAPESLWDVRRFRPNLFVECDDGEGYPEQTWIGRRVRVGTATLEIAMGCPRCVMVTLAEGDLPQDHRVMRTLVRESHHIAGIYARIAEEGEVREGDAVVLLE